MPCPPITALSPRLTLCTGGTRTLIMYSMRLWECFSITDSIHIKGLTCRGGWRWHSPGRVTKPRFTDRDRGLGRWAICSGVSPV